jgi:hypothetical protein
MVLVDDKKTNRSRLGLIKKFLIVLLIVFVAGMVFISFSGETFKFTSFNGPSYIPSGYNNTENHTNNNERIFEYSGNGTFWVGVVKNTSNPDLKDLFNPFDEDPDYINQTKENITVNGHIVVFEVHSMDINMKEMAQGISQLENYDMPNLSFAKFYASWYCEKSNLTFVATGMITMNQTEDMKKMIKSIQCHQSNKYIIF